MRPTVRLDCARKTHGDVLADLVARLPGGESSVTVVVENLRSLEGSITSLLKSLFRSGEELGLRLDIVDRSGCADAFFSAMAR